MAWIESHQSLGSHRKRKRLSRRLDINARETVGLLQFVWWWCIDNAPDGDITDIEPEDLADSAEWEGDPREFWDALVYAGFVDRSDDGRHTIHDWWEFAGKLIQRRKDDAARKRHAASRPKESNGDPNPHIRNTEALPTDIQRNSTGGLKEVVKTAYVPNQPTVPTQQTDSNQQTDLRTSPISTYVTIEGGVGETNGHNPFASETTAGGETKKRRTKTPPKAVGPPYADIKDSLPAEVRVKADAVFLLGPYEAMAESAAQTLQLLDCIRDLPEMEYRTEALERIAYCEKIHKPDVLISGLINQVRRHAKNNPRSRDRPEHPEFIPHRFTPEEIAAVDAREKAKADRSHEEWMAQQKQRSAYDS